MNKCISCGEKLDKGEKIYRCPKCGLGQTISRNDTKYHVYHRDETYKSEEEQFKNIFAKRAATISNLKLQGDPLKILEVGSSTGLLLALLKKKGWGVLGIEPSKKAAEVAKERAIKTLNTSFEQAKIKKESFDLVVLNHVLEHMENPIGVLAKVSQLIKKDGIVFIDVPNFGSLSAKIFGNSWKYILPEEHRWHFTYTSLKNLLERTGFRVIFRETRSGIWDYQNPAKEIWDSARGLKKRFIPNILTAVPTYFLGKLKLGTSLTVIARKK